MNTNYIYDRNFQEVIIEDLKGTYKNKPGNKMYRVYSVYFKALNF